MSRHIVSVVLTANQIGSIQATEARTSVFLVFQCPNTSERMFLKRTHFAIQ